MKKLVSLCLLAMTAMTCITGCTSSSTLPEASSPAAVTYTAGTYKSVQTGMGGQFEVSVTFSDRYGKRYKFGRCGFRRDAGKGQCDDPRGNGR